MRGVGYPFPMWRNRDPDSNRPAEPALRRKIDLPVLVVSVLSAFFATLFATLLLTRPERDDPREPLPDDSVQSAPSVAAPPVDATPALAPAIDLPPVEAPPPERGPRAEPAEDRSLRAVLEELGVKCAEGANCYPE